MEKSRVLFLDCLRQRTSMYKYRKSLAFWKSRPFEKDKMVLLCSTIFSNQHKNPHYESFRRYISINRRLLCASRIYNQAFPSKKNQPPLWVPHKNLHAAPRGMGLCTKIFRKWNDENWNHNAVTGRSDLVSRHSVQRGHCCSHSTHRSFPPVYVFSSGTRAKKTISQNINACRSSKTIWCRWRH